MVLKQPLGKTVLSASSLCRIEICFLIITSILGNLGLYLVTNLILLTWLVFGLLFLASPLDILLIFLNCSSTREGL